MITVKIRSEEIFAQNVEELFPHEASSSEVVTALNFGVELLQFSNKARLIKLPQGTAILWTPGKIFKGYERAERVAALMKSRQELVSSKALEKECKNLFLEEDGYCPLCGQVHPRPKVWRDDPPELEFKVKHPALEKELDKGVDNNRAPRAHLNSFWTQMSDL
jgi:hypothetical protein